MKKTYKSEAREVKKRALAARLTFRQRKLFLHIQPYLTAMFFMILSGVIVSIGVDNKYPIVVWFALCIISIPLYLIVLVMFNCIPKFKTLDEHIEYSLKEYLKQHSWRNVSMLLKKHKFPKIIESALLRILLKKVSKMVKKKEIIETLEKFGHVKYIEEENRFKMTRKKEKG